jgi:EAL domain-containing protein (putative c-di-GMP-specific phosphodiesterase class I)
VRDLTTNTQSQSMVRAILDIARDLDLETVAEFVETVELAARVAAMGVTYAQGYAFGVPRPLTEVLDDLLQRRSELQDFWYAGQLAKAERNNPVATLPIVRSA